MRRRTIWVAVALGAGICSACGASIQRPQVAARDQSAAALALDLAQTRPAGQGEAFRPPPLGGPAVSRGAPLGSLSCRMRSPVAYGAHLELFAEDRGVVVPAGIGIALPRRRQGAFVTGGRCLYPLRTVDPTGVIEVGRSGLRRLPRLAEFFSLWGQPLSRTRLAGFHGTVVAFLDGRRWNGNPELIPLWPHAQIVLEVGPAVAPHASYLFPRGL